MRTCEICCQSANFSKHETICQRCDDKMAFEQFLEAKDRATSHASKYKCMNCGKGLTENRRRNCMTCEPELPADSPFFAHMSSTSNAIQARKPRLELVPPATFNCSTCKTENMPISECAVKKDKFNTYFNRCRACNRASNARAKAKNLARIVELRAQRDMAVAS
jgi:hypothetical protein